MLFKPSMLPQILVIGFHLHDIIQTEHTNQLNPLWRYFYTRNVNHGFSIMESIISAIKKQGYEFSLMRDFVKSKF